MTMSRRAMALATVGLVVAASAGGWLAGSQIRSPAEMAARIAAPVPSPILAPAERRVLSTTIVARGTARYTLPRVVSIQPSRLKVGAGVISSVAPIGTELTEGAVALTASGRPVFVLEGSIPAYRDLGPGLTGDDVLQLEKALARLGHDPGPIDGVYDRQTGAAVAAWYRAAGWQPFEATADQLAAVRALELEAIKLRSDKLAAGDAVAAASADLAAARAASAAARDEAAAAPDSVRSAEAGATAANQAAQANVAVMKAARDRIAADPAGAPERVAAAAVARSSEADLARARAALSNAAEAVSVSSLAVAAAMASADAANQAAAADVASKRAIRNQVLSDPQATPADRQAADAALAASIALQTATATTGQLTVQQAQAAADAAEGERVLAATQVAAAEQASADAAAALARILDPARQAAELAAAERDLAAAISSAEATRLAGIAAVNAARRSATQTQRAIGAAAASVDAADRRFMSARTLLGYLDAPLRQLGKELATTSLRAGIQVPADEVVFLASVPARVEQVSAVNGDQVAGPVFTVTGNQLAVDTSLPLEEAPLLRAGMAVAIDEPSLGIAGTGVVSRVADKPGTNGVDGFHVYVEVQVKEAPVSIVGTSVRLTIPVKSTGASVLAVPVSALSLAADGSSQVEVQRNGTLEPVTVTPGLVAEGFVAVTPVTGSLEPGELVVIGFDQPAAVPGG